jgi:hypothetical protein
LTETEPAWPPLHGVLHAAILTEIDRSLAFLRDEQQIPRGQRKPNVGPAVRDYLADQIAWLIVGMFNQAPAGPSEWGDATTEWTWGVRQPDGTPGRKGPIVGEATARKAVGEPFEVAGYVKVLLARGVEAWRETD